MLDVVLTVTALPVTCLLISDSTDILFSVSLLSMYQCTLDNRKSQLIRTFTEVQHNGLFTSENFTT